MNDKVIEIKIIKKKTYIDDVCLIPKYATLGSSGLDLRVCIDSPVCVYPNSTVLLETGIAIYIKYRNIAGIILPRSGLGHNNGIVLGNLIGLIDSDYQGEIKISCWNRSRNNYFINPGERVAQLVFISIEKVRFNLVSSFQESKRFDNGFGSTGIK
ncbi:deoxyuridine 5'-triphosphate nucleotidohydrolase [Candidatus Legionella polyplacis]|uniref:dUTP diphosphatase n=1 Tax=Candidatus Legionella polyplacis TaxID=2005262 RepID=UPI000C1DD8DA|nr:dUTP diphosphatase [Candidatus Legionella polyplacis]ATW01881.1 deoxyuridine 5'-triphosphate nucleotidohydrolase [Candidatus Legionella polyplacis]